MKSESPLAATIAGVLLFAVGLAIGAGLILVNRQEEEALAGWQRARGTVIDLLKRRTIDGEVVTPLVAFTTTAGERISFTAAPSRESSQYWVTASVPVLYEPSRPQEARIDARSRRWTRNALAAGAAVILMGLGGYVAWYASRWQPPTDVESS